MFLLVELAWAGKLVAIAGGVVLLAFGLAHFAWRHRRVHVAVGRIAELAERGYAGYEVVLIEGDCFILELVTRIEAPAGSGLLFDTRDAAIPEGLSPVTLGVPALDRRFPVCAATELTARCLHANRAQLEAVSDFVAGWRNRLDAICVQADRVRFQFDPSQVALLDRALPSMAQFAGVVLSAVRWLPPSGELPPQDAGPFRQAGGGRDAQWFLEVAERRAGPFTLEEVLALMRQGRVSWLTPASAGVDAPALPLARQDALAPVRAPATEAARATPPQGPSQRPPLALAESWLVLGLLWLLLLIPSLFAEPNLSRAARGRASESWPTAPGRIISARLLTQRDSDGEPRYRADIRYEYTALGGKHLGDRVLYYYRWGFDGHSYNQAAENGVVLRYPVGREVRVHYDPAEPEESVLEPGQVLSELVCGLVALGFMALATLLLLLVVLGRVRVWRVRQRAHELASLAGAR